MAASRLRQTRIYTKGSAVLKDTDFNTPNSPSLSAATIAGMQLSFVPGVGPKLHRALVRHFGSAEAVLSAAPSFLARVPGVGNQLAKRIAAASDEIDVEAELTTCRENGFRVLSIDEPGYPQRLTEIEDPPRALFVDGQLMETDALCVAIVGSRHATHYGKRIAARIAGALARAGLTIVSGMARGIDACAHHGAIDVGGRTIAVLPAGLLNLYPNEHRELAFDIARQGALVTEHPCGWPVRAGAFPRRNRIITGFSLGTIVVEAAERSGALTSARHAMEQGREVFAVPGPIDSRMSRGCHALLRDGATLVESPDDVLEALGPMSEPMIADDGHEVRHPAELQLNAQEKLVLAQIGTEPTGIDALVSDTGLEVSRVLATISALEMRRLIRRVSGQYVCRI